MGSDPRDLFRLRVKLSGGILNVLAREAGFQEPNHTKVIIGATWNGKPLFELGSTWVGVPSHSSLDGIYTKEAVLSCLAMKPGDTDREYFESYTPEQLAWAESHGEELFMVKDSRYCDENGNVKEE
jgi:hypothetical protein